MTLRGQGRFERDSSPRPGGQTSPGSKSPRRGERAPRNGSPACPTVALLLMMNREGIIVHAGGESLKLLGGADELLGRSIADVFRKEPDVLENVRGALEGRPNALDLRSGRKVLQCYVSPTHDPRGGGIGAVLIALDPEGFTYEAAVRRTNGRLETVGLLAGGVAHDFNNALTAILGYSDLMRRRMEPSNELRRYVEEINKAGESAARLTRQLVMFSRRSGGEPRALSLNQVVTGLVKMLRRLIGEDLELATQLDESLERAYVDEAEIEQVIVNLALGLRRLMPLGGKLTIETSNLVVEPGGDPILDDLGPGEYLRLSLTGEGEGLLEPGRAIESGVFGVTRIVGRAGGSVEVVPVSGNWTAFRVYLPTAQRRIVDAQANAGGSARTTAASKRILVVEDDPLVRDLISQILHSRGYAVLVASCGKEAIEIVESHAGTIDLMMTDVVMPGIPGPETARRIREREPRLKVLFMSGYADETLANHGLPAHADGFLEKPFAPEVLAGKVREILSD